MNARDARGRQRLISTLMTGKGFLCLIIAACVIAVYGQTTGFDFVDYDDPAYVTHNVHVRHGLSVSGITWAFTAVYGSNWHPLTWISHMLDIELFGMNAGMHHLTNTLLHGLNAICLFLVLEAMTRSRIKSLLVALLFAVHPLHVESAAWIAERKDVLSTLFWMLTMAAYLAYAKRPSAKRYLAVILTFALGLMAKPMLVTLPVVLILLDLWPLGRLRLASEKTPEAPKSSPQALSPGRALLEKAPLFALSLASSTITFYAQYTGGSVRTLDELPLAARLANATVAYSMYLAKTVAPVNLAAFYPFPPTIPASAVAASGAFLILISIAALASWKKVPALTVGWLWYVTTLLPVIGIIQVGRQSMADRYTYIPLVGIFIAAVWGADELMKGFPRMRKPALAASAVLIVLLISLAHRQAGVWRDSVSLFSHALAVTRDNYLAHYNLGCELQKRGRTDEAIRHYRESIRIKPDLTGAHNNLACILLERGMLDEAIAHFEMSLKADPSQARAYNNLGTAYFRKGDLVKALEYFKKACTVDPTYAEARKNLSEAMKAVKLIEKKRDAAIEEMEKRPYDIRPRLKAADALRRLGKFDEAAGHYKRSLELDGRCKEAMKGLALVARDRSRWDEAIFWLRKLSSLNPRDPLPYYDMACVYALWGKKDLATTHLKKALDLGFSDTRLMAGDPDLASLRSDPAFACLVTPRAK